MLRIHFTVADAMKVRMVVLGPLAELLFSLTRLLESREGLLFDGWRSRTLAGAQVLRPEVQDMARFLAPPGVGLVDLFTLVGPAADLNEAFDRLCSVPAGPLTGEFAIVSTAAGNHTSWMLDFAKGHREARHRLNSALTEYHELAIAPYWHRIRTLLENERAARTDVMLAHGLDAMLTGMAPTMRWTAPVLEVRNYRGLRPANRPVETSTDRYLNGRGLLLAPSFYCRSDPALYTPWHDGPAVLTYPIDLTMSTTSTIWRPLERPGDPALTGLLGRTRAAALRAITDGCTTTGLAATLGITPGGASQHATILREAGLIVSHRHGNTVRHTLTRLGRDLLNG
ncbi:ArsR/SmtB family transcription factor [Micromonospora chersina]|uniref:ArsR/SmtB family transcription factor n=1 Tax=Micromonospora chersina TaxID=47854 RepID=UPI003720A81C